jgi:hypothetical protein
MFACKSIYNYRLSSPPYAEEFGKETPLANLQDYLEKYSQKSD